MLAGVVAAGDVPQRRLGVAGGRLRQRPCAPGRPPASAARCSACTTPGSGSGRPGGRAADRCGRSPSPGRTASSARPSPGPGRNRWNQAPELGRRQHAPHQVGLHQARREEVGAVRLPAGRDVGVLARSRPGCAPRPAPAAACRRPPARSRGRTPGRTRCSDARRCGSGRSASGRTSR